MDKIVPDPLTFWCVFCDPPKPPHMTYRERLLSQGLRLLRPGFRHVFCYRRACHFEGWLILHPHKGWIDVLEVKGDDYITLLHEHAKNKQVHILKVQAQRRKRWHTRGPLTCVSVLAHLLGVKTPFLATPWRFYHRLRCYEGGEPL